MSVLSERVKYSRLNYDRHAMDTTNKQSEYTCTNKDFSLSHRMNCTVSTQRSAPGDCEQEVKLKNVKTRDQTCQVRQSILFQHPRPLSWVARKTVRRQFTQFVGEDCYSIVLEYSMLPIPSVHL